MLDHEHQMLVVNAISHAAEMARHAILSTAAGRGAKRHLSPCEDWRAPGPRYRSEGVEKEIKTSRGNPGYFPALSIAHGYCHNFPNPKIQSTP